MIYAATAEEIEERRKAFLRKWRLRHRAVAESLEEAGDKLFTFTRLPPSQWKSARTTSNLMGFLRGKDFVIEGTFARLMYQSLYKMHQQALHGTTKVVLDTIARTLTRRTEPRVKLH